MEQYQNAYCTACHELGHDLGLADLYNTGYSSTKQNVNGMSLMGMGSWGYREGELPGTTPTHIDAYGKVYLGFYNAQELEVNGRYNLALECNNFLDETVYDNYKLQKPGRTFVAKFRLFIN